MNHLASSFGIRSDLASKAPTLFQRVNKIDNLLPSKSVCHFGLLPVLHFPSTTHAPRPSPPFPSFSIAVPSLYIVWQARLSHSFEHTIQVRLGRTINHKLSSWERLVDDSVA